MAQDAEYMGTLTSMHTAIIEQAMGTEFDTTEEALTIFAIQASRLTLMSMIDCLDQAVKALIDNQKIIRLQGRGQEADAREPVVDYLMAISLSLSESLDNWDKYPLIPELIDWRTQDLELRPVRRRILDDAQQLNDAWLQDKVVTGNELIKSLSDIEEAPRPKTDKNLREAFQKTGKYPTIKDWADLKKEPIPDYDDLSYEAIISSLREGHQADRAYYEGLRAEGFADIVDDIRRNNPDMDTDTTEEE